MAERCPHLDYRSEAGDRSFDRERAYCTVVDAFVAPMRADVCNARHGLSPRAHCEFYREHEGLGPTEGLALSHEREPGADASAAPSDRTGGPTDG